MNNKCVYIHLHPKTQEVYYVGIGLPKRAFDFCRRSKLWHEHRAIYGEPIVIVLAENLTVEKAGEYEKAIIKKYGRMGIDSNGVLLNRVTGLGAAGAVYSEERNRKVSEAKKGFRFSEEAKIKMSKAHKGKKLSEEHKMKIGDSIRGPKNGRFGAIVSLETREKLRLHNVGKKQSAETVAKRIESVRKTKLAKLLNVN